MSKKILFSFLLVLAISSVWTIPVHAAYLRGVPVHVTQPDGTVLVCLASGDEYYNWLHDKNGYTIMRNPATGFLVYANKVDGRLMPTEFIAGRTDALTLEQAGIKAGLLDGKKIQSMARLAAAMTEPSVNAPQTGTINNLVVYIRFSDQDEFAEAFITDTTTSFNSSDSGVNSFKNYFTEASYDQLTVGSTFYPGSTPGVYSYQDTYPRAYYMPYDATTNPGGYDGDSDRAMREHALLRNAIDSISSEVPAGLNIDGDSDGYVDNICFIIKGEPTAWATLLWPHKWALYTAPYAYINGKTVWTYNFQLETSLTVSVICHEMFHSLGAPDLYHYVEDYQYLSPAWAWDLMELNLNPPQHMGAYMKWKYGHWISSIPEITTSGVYTLHPLTSATNNCYKIASPNSATQYFIVEYRRATDGGTFDGNLVNEGLLVYRINTAYTGNANGPPDEVYIYRPDGTPWLDGEPWYAPFSADQARTEINDGTNPSSFLWDGTDSGAPGGLRIFDVGYLGSMVSFSVAVGAVAVTSPNGGESFVAGQAADITWTSTGTIPSVDIDLSTDGGSNWTTLVNDTANDGAESVVVPASPSSNCLIRVAEGSIGAPSDFSDGPFTITLPTASITVSSPNGGENWLAGSMQAITWTWTGAIASVAIDYSIDGGENWSPIAVSAENTGNYSWTVPTASSTSCRLRISDASNGAVVDSSDNLFSIYYVAPGSAQWAKAIAGSGYDCPFAILGTSDGGFLIVANSASWGGGDDTWVIKLRQDGQREWDRLYRTSGGHVTVAATQTSDDGYLILINHPTAGFSTSLFKISQTGIVLWQKSFEGSQTNNPVSMYRTSDDGCVIAGSTNGQTSPAWIMRVSSTGSPVWLKEFSLEQITAIASIAPANDGGIVIVGSASNEPTGTIIGLKLTSAGEVDQTAGWQNLLQPGEASSGSSIEIRATADGGYAIMGSSSTGTQLWFAKLTSVGQVSWQYTYSSAGAYYQPESFKQTPDGGFIITGIYMSGGNKAFLVKLDASGNFLWGRLANFDLVGEGISVVNTPDNGLAMTGTDASVSRADIMCAKLASNGLINESCNAIQDATWTGEATSLATVGTTISPITSAVPNAADLILSTPTPTGIQEIAYCQGTSLEPVISEISPSSGPVGTEVLISGANFGASLGSVLFNGEPAAVASWTEGSIVCSVPSMTTVGSIPVFIRASDGRTSEPVSFLVTVLSQGLTITSPNGGETWVAGTTRNVTWATTGVVTTVEISYSTNGGQIWLPVAASAPNTGTYAWSVPYNPSATCLVKVTDASNSLIFDASDAVFSIILDWPVALTKLGEWPGSQVDSIWLQGNYAYCGTGTSGTFGLNAIDISNPSSPQSVGRYATDSYSNGVCVVGSLAYFASGYSGLSIVDMSDPTTPSLIGQYDTSAIAVDVFVKGNYAYLVTSYTGLYEGNLLVIDISNPASPALAASSPEPHFPTEVFISGDYAYVTENLGGLLIFDISDPAATHLAGQFELPYSDSRGVFVSNNLAYVADWFYGLLIVDITDPASPVLSGQYDCSYGSCVYISGRYAFLAVGVNGVRAIDVSNPASPTLAASYDTPGDALHLVVRNNIIYIADYDSLQILGLAEIHKDDFVGTWDGQGVYYRNSDTGAWVRLASPATMITTGDLDGDGIGDIIGLWPAQGGIWAKCSQSGAWVRLSSTATHIAVGDMNGDGRDDLVGTWDGQGTYFRDSATGAWNKLASPANLVAAGDLDGDGVDDLIGTWPGQGGIWVKYSASQAWARLSSTARDIAAGDMNGDGRADFVGTWDGQGVYYRDSVGGTWIKMSSPAEQTTCGDIDGDGIADLIGIWPSQGGVWVKYSGPLTWEKFSSTAVDIATARMRSVGADIGQLGTALALPSGGTEPGPEGALNIVDISQTGPGGREFKFKEEKNVEPGRGEIEKARNRSTAGPGEPGFKSVDQKNIYPRESMREKKGPDRGKKRIRLR